MIEQLQKNQKAITSGLEDLALLNQLLETSSQSTTLPIGNRPEMMNSNFDKGFGKNEMVDLTGFCSRRGSARVKMVLKSWKHGVLIPPSPILLPFLKPCRPFSKASVFISDIGRLSVGEG